jgi:cathepsin L
MELNQFADLTTEEFAALYLMAPRQLTNTGKCTMSVPDVNIPAELDWTTSGAVTGVKNQGQCGSCWAFSSTGALEGLYFNTNKKLISFSEQQLVDCSTAYGNAGCNGGLMNQTFWYVKDNGITTEDKYAYTGANGKCKYTSAMEVFRNKDCAEITVNSEKSLTTALGTGPVSVAIQANQLGFQLYKKGVFSGNCGHNLDHGVLAVGFGTENGQKYYKVKNSWGATWGLNGFILMARNGDGPGQCGIQMAATLPL